MRIPIALYAGALAVRALMFGLHADPAYPDSYYYTEVARSLQAGHGFSIDFIWSFLDVGGRIPANPTLPIPSNAHWMPLASLIQLPTIWLLGPTALASALPFILFGALAAPLTWLLAREITPHRGVALCAGLALAIPAGTTLFVAQPDALSLYQPLGTLALLLAARGLKGDGRAFAASGLIVGLATLARNDGVVLGAVIGGLFLWQRWRSWRAAHPSAGGHHDDSPATQPAVVPWRYAFACFALFLAVMAPWYLRQLAVFGSLSPSTSSGRVLLIATYEQMNSVTSDTSLAAFLGQGPVSLLASRWGGLVSALQVFFVIAVPTVLAPFALGEMWLRRSQPALRPFLVYALVLLAAAGLLFAVHVPYGTFLHSAVALMPYTYILAFAGLVRASGPVAARIKSWTPEGGARLFLIAGMAAVILTAAGYSAAALPSWNQIRDDRAAAGVELDLLGAPDTDVLLSADPAGFRYVTGRPGVVTPNDSLEVIRQVAVDYDARWLILERMSVVTPLVPVLEGLSHPDWLGSPVYVRPYTGPKAGNQTDLAPELVIYPICLASSESRCQAASTTPGPSATTGWRAAR